MVLLLAVLLGISTGGAHLTRRICHIVRDHAGETRNRRVDALDGAWSARCGCQAVSDDAVPNTAK